MQRRLRAALFGFALARIAAVDSAAFDHRRFTEARASQPVSDPLVQEAAKFAVDELRLLSDSGIYSTLSLHEVLDASTQLGDFHYVTHLRVALTSPHFASREPLETFEMMVLEPKPEAPSTERPRRHTARSIAIDEFPAMDEAATEEFWIRKVEDRRRRRRELFAQWEIDGLTLDRDGLDEEQMTMEEMTITKKKTLLSLEQLQGMSTPELRELLANRASSEVLRTAVARIIDERLERLERLERDTVGIPSEKTKDEL